MKKDHYKGIKKVKKTSQPKKAPNSPEFVDTDSDDSDDEQERQPKKAPKTPEYSGDEQAPAVNHQRCIVMYSTEDEQVPAVKKLQKILEIPKFIDTGPGAEYEQEPQKGSKTSGCPDNETPQETSLGEPTKKPPVTGRTSAASCIHVLMSGIRKGKQCRFKALDETGKFCHHHKQT